MNILARFLSIPFVADTLLKVAKLNPYVHIPSADIKDAKKGEYMERYWLVPESWKLPFAIRLHVIKRPDTDRHLHDHPFDFTTYIMDGGYWEERFCFPHYLNAFPEHVVHQTSVWYHSAGEKYTLKADEARGEGYHRICEIDPGRHGGVLSLFIYGKRKQPWGFMTEKGKVNFEDYTID
jgi:hypothetical protein